MIPYSFLDDAASLAKEKEHDGDLREAADIRALLGMSQFIYNGGQYEYERSSGSASRPFRYGITWLLHAISLYQRTNKTIHALYAKTLVEPMIDTMEESVTYPFWVGIANELRGDMHQMVGNGDPIEQYQKAQEIYEEEEIEFKDMGPAFDSSMDAYLDFIRHRGIDPQYGEEAGKLVVRHHDRIIFKIDVAKELVNRS